MCPAQGPQRSDAGEARTRGPSVSSQALYHWATAFPSAVTFSKDLGQFPIQSAQIFDSMWLA